MSTSLKASGLPLVAVATSDHRGIMQDEVEGLLVPVGDSVALADAIARLLDSPAFARRLGAAARARVAQTHRLSCTASKHLELLANLARGERGTA